MFPSLLAGYLLLLVSDPLRLVCLLKFYFLDHIQGLNGYTYPADGDSLFEYEEGITFYYTKKGIELVHRWIKRMEAIFDKYFPDDYGFQPKCCYWKVF